MHIDPIGYYVITSYIIMFTALLVLFARSKNFDDFDGANGDAVPTILFCFMAPITMAGVIFFGSLFLLFYGVWKFSRLTRYLLGIK